MRIIQQNQGDLKTLRTKYIILEDFERLVKERAALNKKIKL